MDHTRLDQLLHGLTTKVEHAMKSDGIAHTSVTEHSPLGARCAIVSTADPSEAFQERYDMTVLLCILPDPCRPTPGRSPTSRHSGLAT